MRAWIQNLTLSSVVVLLALLVFEFGLRWWDDEPLFEFRNFVIKAWDHAFAGPGVLHDPLLGWVHAANQGNKGAGFLTGEYGVRMNSSKREPVEPGGVLVSGDSFAAGSEVKNEQTFPAVLEKLMNKPVVNAATGGWGFDQQFLRARSLYDKLKPEVIVLGLAPGDLINSARDIHGGRFKPHFKLKNGRYELSGVPTPKLDKALTNLDWPRRVFGYSYLAHWVLRQSGQSKWWIEQSLRTRDFTDKWVELNCAIIEIIVKFQEEKGLRVVILMQYGGSAITQGAAPPWAVEFLSCAKNSGLITVDMFSPFLVEYQKGQDHLAELYVLHKGGVYGHPSPKGQAVTARAIYDALREN